MSQDEIKALSDFISASRNRSQSAIIKEFLATIIKRKLICESGSILIDAPEEQALILFNDDDFLVKEGFLMAGKPWSTKFGYFDGIAGLAYRTKEVQCVNDVQQNADFSERDGDVPIAHMVCVPILLNNLSLPFGVACFHNSDQEDRFTQDDFTMIKAYANTLGTMLELSKMNLKCEQSRKVFLVHGHDRLSLLEMEKLLMSVNVLPIVMKDQPKTGQELLEMLEKIIDGCRGGFVIMTPDDLGRDCSNSDKELMPRARQNVIFEAGMLTALFRGNNKVCFLLKQPLEIPSDMKGLLYEEFEDNIDEARIKNILKNWGLCLG